MDDRQRMNLGGQPEAVPLGANLLGNGIGATFRTWAPEAREVRVRWGYTQDDHHNWFHQHEVKLQRHADGTWGGLIPGLREGERYMFYIVGPEGGSEGSKRDPYARDLTDHPAWPHCQCLLCDPRRFPWHDAGYRPPYFHELIIYQFHIGTWYIPDDSSNGTFLSVMEKLPYLTSLGINAIQPLPIVEFPTAFSLGYNGVDYFSPETDYGVSQDDPRLDHYLHTANQLLQAIDPAHAPYTAQDIDGTANQLRLLIDLCHLHGIAVILDVVYNHAGGNFTEQGLYFFDGQPRDNQNNSLYFTDRGWAGGLVFAYWKNEVKQFLINNALFYLEEYHADGFRYDEVSVIRHEGGEHGWQFCQYVTDTCHYVKPTAIHIAEHWPVDDRVVHATAAGGAGFDATQNDGLRDALRDAIAQASSGAHAHVDLERIAQQLKAPRLNDHWRAVQCSENHDIVYRDRGQRIPRLADSSNSRSWHARSRSRVALGLTLTAPGIAHLFMGQEFLEDKQWHDEPGSQFQLWWQGLAVDKTMADFLRFSQELIWLRRRLGGLNGSGLNVFHIHNDNRLLAFHRWVPGQGHDVVVVASLNESTHFNYRLGFPLPGHWQEAFNSDVYDNWVNPWTVGNHGGIDAMAPGIHNLPAAANIVIPANSVVIFVKE